MKSILCALAALVASALSATPAFPLKVSDDGRYLADSKGAPFLYLADTGWRLFTDLTTDEAEQYLADRRAKGFTVIQSQLVVHRGEGQAVTRDGIATFLDTKNEDLAQPNPAYFAHAEMLVGKAADKGLLMAMSSLWFGYKGTGYFAALDQTKARAFGRYLGERFKRFDNVLWIHGGDFRPGEKIAAVRELAAGLRESAPHHLQTFHNGDNTASTEDFASDAWLDIDMLESVDPPETYSRVLGAYGRTQPRVRPVILGEPPYENERKTDAFGARSRAWWTMTSGAAGHAFGVFPVWRFGANWQTAMQSPGSQQMKHLRALLEARRWPELAPDEKSEIVTAGRGQFGSTEFASVAATRDRKLALAYLPTARAVTVNFAALHGPVQARWFDPTDGSFREIAGTPFAASGKHELAPPAMNSAGASDFVLVLETNAAGEIELPAKTYQDRIRGAWAGQAFGAAYAMSWSASSAPREIMERTPAQLSNAASQPLFHLQGSFLQAMEKHGANVTRSQAAALFRATEFPLHHASLAARQNLRRGMLPNFTGHPRYNPHSDDHDFQSAAAVLGLVRPGSPRDAAKLADLFGGMISYGDGQYGGRFLATVYAQTFLEKDATGEAIERCLRAGLAAVHPDSAYAAVGREVLAQFHREPNDWQKARAAIWDRWGEGDLCPQGAHEAENFDAKLNGGFIMIGLLYGRGDLARTLEITAACGQQIRENSAATAGVLGSLLGCKGLSRAAGVDESALADLPLADRASAEVVRACEGVARACPPRSTVEGQPLRIEAQSPEAPRELEQMHAAFNRRQLQQWNSATTAAFFDKMPQWDADWELVSTGYDGAPSVRKFQGRPAVLVTHPVDKVEPAILQRTVQVPLKNPRLLLTVASFPDAATDDKKSVADWLLRVVVNGKPILEKVIDTEDRWEEVSVDLSRYAGKTVVLSLENAPGGALEFAYETAYWASAKIVGE